MWLGVWHLEEEANNLNFFKFPLPLGDSGSGWVDSFNMSPFERPHLYYCPFLFLLLLGS